MKEKYESLSLAVLKELAKARGMRGISTMKKSRLIEAMLEQDEKDRQSENAGEAQQQADGGAEHESGSAVRHQEEESAGREAEGTERHQEDDSAEREPESGSMAQQSERDGVVRYYQENDSSQRQSQKSEPAQQPDGSDGAVRTESAQAEQNPRRRGVGMRQPQGSRRTGGRELSNNSAQQAQGTFSEPVAEYRSAPSRQRQVRPGNDETRVRRTRPEYRQRQEGDSGYTRQSRGDYQQRNESQSRSDYQQKNESQGRSDYQQRSESQGRSDYQQRSESQGRSDYQQRGESQSRSDYQQRSESQSRGDYQSRNDGQQRADGDDTRQRTDYQQRADGSDTRQRADCGDTRQRTDYQQRPDNEDTRQRPENIDRPPAELSQLDSGQTVSGILEVMSDGYGFIRSANYLPGDNDVYVSPSQIRRFNLKTGDIICGNTRIKSQQEKFSALLYLKTINDKTPSEAMKRWNFEDMTPIFPNERMRMERGSRAIAMRIVDLFSPIGKGQRGMIVSPPKAGKTTLLKDIARSILENDPDMKLLILLIDERPEEVTDIKEAICGENVEVIYSTFDELPEHHKRVSEMVIERAKRLVEQNENVTILLDSITRLARAYNLTVPPSGRTLSGGLDPAALHMPKRFFGAARKMREGGSLTILATALVDTGSKMDDVVYEEFKGTGNMELVLDRKLSEKRVFPAIDIPKSGTRREDLLLDRDEQEAMYIMRRALNGMKSDEAVENILNTFVHTRDNHELVQRVRRQKYV